MEETATRYRVTLGNVLTFLGMITVAISVYYTGAGQTSADIAILKTEQANEKAAIAQLRADTTNNQATTHSETNQVFRDVGARIDTLNTRIDSLKDQIAEIKGLVSKDGRTR